MAKALQQPQDKTCLFMDLPVELAKRVASYMHPIYVNMYEPSDLRSMIEEYPLKYLGLKLSHRDIYPEVTEMEEIAQILEETSDKVKEVVFIDHFSYKNCRMLADKLLEMKLEWLTLVTSELDVEDLKYFVQSCCESNCVRHFIGMSVRGTEAWPGEAACEVDKLVSEDKSACVGTSDR